ncbi:MAG TPA: hypothetical protein PKA00_01805 [Saprospiraceae bacterium]|nr:hypothetical protein [Saprospiraceae bacterium]HMQ81605.1 hypothetical protein [Saprospiraceae bacterium]
MTNEDLLREFLQDDLIETKYGISKEKAMAWKFTDQGSKLIDAMKQAILKKQNGDSEETISRNLNSMLMK